MAARSPVGRGQSMKNDRELLFPSRGWVVARPPEVDHSLAHDQRCPPKTSRVPVKVGRRIILCFDGTGNQFSDNNSNVLLFFKCLEKDNDDQLVYYQTGIGTYTHPWLATKPIVDLSMKLDAALAWNLEDHVQDAYRFLMQTYKEGDKVSLFGFSRGAYTARVLAGLLQKVGLLSIENHAQIPFAWNVFKKSDCREGLVKCAEYKNSFSVPISIDFVGLWDTVASVGVSGRELPFVRPMRKSRVRVFRHALALDERRAKFTPNFKLAIPYCGEDVDAEVDDDVKEVWFAGCHCDVGGGYVHNSIRNSLACISLRWMIRECFRMETGIKFDEKTLADIGLQGPPFNQRRYRRIADPEPKTPHNLITSTVNLLHDIILPLVILAKYLFIILSFPLRYVWHLLMYARCFKRMRPRQPHFDLERGAMGINASEVEDVEPFNEVDEEGRDALSPMHDQLSKIWLWWIFEVWPLVFRLQNSVHGLRTDLETRFNLGRGRKIYGDAWNRVGDGDGQMKYVYVHRSVFTRMKETRGTYRPRAWFSLADDREFHWEGDFNETTVESDLERREGWERIRWVDVNNP